MSQKVKIEEGLIILGLIAFAYYKYSKMTEQEKSDIARHIRETGKKVIEEFVSGEIKAFLPGSLK